MKSVINSLILDPDRNVLIYYSNHLALFALRCSMTQWELYWWESLSYCIESAFLCIFHPIRRNRFIMVQNTWSYCELPLCNNNNPIFRTKARVKQLRNFVQLHRCKNVQNLTKLHIPIYQCSGHENYTYLFPLLYQNTPSMLGQIYPAKKCNQMC